MPKPHSRLYLSKADYARELARADQATRRYMADNGQAPNDIRFPVYLREVARNHAVYDNSELGFGGMHVPLAMLSSPPPGRVFVTLFSPFHMS